jgi:hypothetical protein
MFVLLKEQEILLMLFLIKQSNLDIVYVVLIYKGQIKNV